MQLPRPIVAVPFLVALAAMAALAPAVAEPLGNAEIEQKISGKRVYLSTPYGLELPLNYRTDGTVTGDLSGFTLARMFAPRETGRWWTENGRLCQRWPTWYDGRQFCFRVSSKGPDRIGWVRDDGLSGTARIEG